MSTGLEFFQLGKLSDAIAATTEAVRDKPTDIASRSMLSELLCFSGDLERADKQLDAAAQVDPESLVGASMLRHLIRSELSRREVFDNGRVPEFLTQPSEAQQKRLKALMSVREGDFETANGLLSEAEEAESSIGGECDGTAFDGFRDLDDVLGPTIEVYTATGKYYWLSSEEVFSLEFSSVEHISDMLWRAAEIETVGDVAGRVHIPALYHGSHESEDERMRIGRATDWIQHNDATPVRGIGQREWLIEDDAIPITSVKSITFHH
ncbi:MAG: type VI secretion system accessory protein TagJ [Fuerstiella sp.]